MKGNPAATFDWPLCTEAESLCEKLLDTFCSAHAQARALRQRFRDEAGVLLLDFVDHLVASPAIEPTLRRLGFRREKATAPHGVRLWAHPQAMLPRIATSPAVRGETPAEVALRVESVADFLHRHGIVAAIEGGPGSAYRRAVAGAEGGCVLRIVERLASRGIVVERAPAGRARDVALVRELWRTRRRGWDDSADGVRHAFELQKRAIELVGRDAACQLYFDEERAYWEFRNRAARLQKRRQDLLGLGWANHDHHTFRCSRRHFADLNRFLQRFGFRKRERFYAGHEAGWGAQISEQALVGIVVFADVDLMPEERSGDFSVHPLPPARELKTVGLWCGLHGDSFLEAGMHHLEARFDFALLRDQLAAEGVGTMKPFSNFDFLKQAFTEGERWRVDPRRVEALRADGFITDAQAQSFLETGAIGSHLENLQRKGGFKGFNQTNVSVIIAATDPRLQQAH